MTHGQIPRPPPDPTPHSWKMIHTHIHTSDHKHTHTCIHTSHTKERNRGAHETSVITWARHRLLAYLKEKEEKEKKKRKELETGKAESGNTRDLSLHACACEIVNRGHGKREKDGKKHRKLARLHTKDSLSFPIVSFLPWRKVKGRR